MSGSVDQWVGLWTSEWVCGPVSGSVDQW